MSCTLEEDEKRFDVFISYSSIDQTIANAVCAKLEEAKIRCWIAPRDIRPGKDWGEEIIRGIEDSKLLVLVFSSNANASQQIKREVERAVHKGLPIVPVRIEDVEPAKALEYFISASHWLDAMTPPIEKHFEYIISSVRSLLEGTGVVKIPPAPPPPPEEPIWQQPKFKVAAVVLGLFLLFFAFRGPSAIESEMVGAWKFHDSVNSLDWHQTNERDGSFDVIMENKEVGTFSVDYRGRIKFDPQNRNGRTSDWTRLDNKTAEADGVVPWQLFNVLAFYTGGKLTVGPKGQFRKIKWKQVGGDYRAPKPNVGLKSPQRWEAEVTFVDIDFNMEVEFGPGANYKFKCVMKDKGKLKAKEGKFTVINGSGAVHHGIYEMIDDDTYSMGHPPFQQTWRRVES